MDKRQHLQDLAKSCEWLLIKKNTDLRFFSRTLPLSRFVDQIRSLIVKCKESPKLKAAIIKQIKYLESGNPPQPLYVEFGDPSLFVIEGEARLVAYYQKEIKEVTVFFCDRANPFVFPIAEFVDDNNEKLQFFY